MSARLTRATAALVLAVGIVAVSLPSGSVVAGCEVVASIASASNAGAYGQASTIASVLDVTTVCWDPGAPARAVGGGDGAPSPCTTQPFGPLAEV